NNENRPVYEIDENHVYDESIPIILDTDPVIASAVVNPVLRRIINNVAALWRRGSTGGGHTEEVYVTGGAANAYTLTVPEPVPNSFLVQFHAAQTTEAINININGQGNRRIFASGTASPPASLLRVNSIWRVVDNGAALILVGGSQPLTTTQAQAEAGTFTGITLWTAQRVRQAINAVTNLISARVDSLESVVQGITTGKITLDPESPRPSLESITDPQAYTLYIVGTAPPEFFMHINGVWKSLGNPVDMSGLLRPATPTELGAVLLSNRTGSAAGSSVRALAVIEVVDAGVVDANAFLSEGIWVFFNISEAINFPAVVNWVGTNSAAQARLEVRRGHLNSNLGTRHTLTSGGGRSFTRRCMNEAGTTWTPWETHLTDARLTHQIPSDWNDLVDPGEYLFNGSVAAFRAALHGPDISPELTSGTIRCHTRVILTSTSGILQISTFHGPVSAGAVLQLLRSRDSVSWADWIRVATSNSLSRVWHSQMRHLTSLADNTQVYIANAGGGTADKRIAIPAFDPEKDVGRIFNWSMVNANSAVSPNLQVNQGAADVRQSIWYLGRLLTHTAPNRLVDIMPPGTIAPTIWDGERFQLLASPGENTEIPMVSSSSSHSSSAKAFSPSPDNFGETMPVNFVFAMRLNAGNTAAGLDATGFDAVGLPGSIPVRHLDGSIPTDRDGRTGTAIAGYHFVVIWTGTQFTVLNRIRPANELPDRRLDALEALMNGSGTPLEVIETTGTGTAYIINPSPAITAFEDGMTFRIFFHATNTGTSPTLALAGVPAEPGVSVVPIRQRAAATVHHNQIGAGTVFDVVMRGGSAILVGANELAQASISEIDAGTFTGMRNYRVVDLARMQRNTFLTGLNPALSGEITEGDRAIEAWGKVANFMRRFGRRSEFLNLHDYLSNDAKASGVTLLDTSFFRIDADGIVTIHVDFLTNGTISSGELFTNLPPEWLPALVGTLDHSRYTFTFSVSPGAMVPTIHYGHINLETGTLQVEVMHTAGMASFTLTHALVRAGA
ncbi:MAG: hypothetical protein FWB75_00005, partial [Oscillospiraceae bacterium]|nr:hypothetical protein [Oscillospiraceae bacterium]